MSFFESINYEPSESNSSSNEQLPQGWSSLDKTYIWNPNNQENALIIPLSPKSTGKLTSLTDFDELQLDFNGLTSQNPPLLSLKMNVAWDESGKDLTTAIIAGKQLVSLKSLRLPSALWKEKGFSYLTKRTFGLVHDSSWNFIRKKNYFFYQNRFHLNLDAVETIDIHFKPNVSLKKITSLSCNVRIGFESLLVPTKIMECARFPKNIFRPNGHLILRIWVGEMLRSKSGNKDNGFLEEIIFQIAEKQLKNIQEQPINSIQFRSFFQPKIPNNDTITKVPEHLETKDRIFHFQTPVITLSSKRKRLIFPLEQLTEKIGRTGKIKNIALSIQPRHWDIPSEFLLQRLRLVSHGSEQRPEIFNIGKKLSTRWGGPFFDQEENSKKIEWVKVQDFFSFNALTINQGSKLTTSLNGVRQVGSNFKTTSDFIDFRGININSQNELQGWHSENDGLILEGKGNWIEIDWPVKTKFDKNTRFFMGFGAGKENILDLTIKPVTKSRELSPISIFPNKPERLKLKSEEIKNLKIKIFLHSSPFRLQLKEVAIFQPALLKPAKILDTPTLVEEETFLFPKNVQISPQKKVTIFKRHLSASLWSKKEGVPNKLSWITKVNRKFNQIQGLKISYKVPPTMHAKNLCWLQFTLVSTNHKVNRTMCSESSTNEIIFPSEMLFHGINFKNDEILKHISWKILAKNKTNSNDQPLSIDIAVSLIGYDIRTFRSALFSHPVMDWNGTALFSTSIKGVSRGDKVSNNFVTSLGHVSIKDKTQATPLIYLLDHPYFQINKITLIKKEPISVNDLVSQTKKTPTHPLDENQGSAYPKLIFFFLLAGVLWWGWKQKERILSLKWLIQLSPELAHKQIRVWLFVAAGHYLFGLVLSLLKWRAGADFFLTLAGLAVLMAWRSFVWKIRPDMESRYPELATKVYGGAGTHYISGFILTLAGAAFFLVIRLEPVAEQIAVVGYYMLVVGVILEVRDFLKNDHEQIKNEEAINTKKERTRA